MNKEITSREAVLKMIVDIEKNKSYANIALKNYLNKNDYNESDKRLITGLVYGIIQNRKKIDYILSQFSKMRIGKMSKWVHNILRIGIYQIMFLDKIPDYASCNECVKLTKKYSHGGSVKFVNGLLRNLSRNKGTIRYPDEKKEPVKYLGIMYSYPEYMIKYMVNNYGYDKTKNICEINKEPSDISINVNTLKTDKKEISYLLEEEGIEVIEGKYYENCLYLRNTGNIEHLNTYRNGLFQIQGESSMLVSKILDPKPGETVMDVCAAPGGKSAHIAQLMKNKGKVISFDIHSHKLDLINRTVDRLGISIVETYLQDATKEIHDFRKKADGVLIDAPCSGWGIIRKKPDIKWNFDKKMLGSITKIQEDILNVSSNYVKNGGVIVYSTCTIRKEENIDIIKKFLYNHKEFKLCNIECYIPLLKENLLNKGSIQLYPSADGIDGFFICKMKKK